jgi:glutamate formiminotransferase/formiminotetrahydrofolate cyclodeaminase
MKLNAFADETASESPAPGGGSISAYVGVLGVSLGTMVANLSASKKGWEDRWEEFSKWAEKGQAYKKQLLDLVDEDTRSFNAIMNGFALPKGTDEEKAIRKQAIQDATKYAIEVPLKVMEVSLATMEVMKSMVEIGNPNSITDAGVGALCARTAVMGAHMNVKINTGSYDDKSFVADILKKAANIEEQAVKLEGEIVGLVNKAIG